MADVLSEAQDPPAGSSPNADCADCQPPHPYRVHWNNGGACSVVDCSCQKFREAPSTLSKLDRCYICDRPQHADGVCPFFPRTTRKRGPP